MSNVLKLQPHIDNGTITVYIVGGYVRDRLLGKTTKDHDFVVVGGTIELMEECGFKQVGASFPVFLADNGDEYALARLEVKEGNGYHGFKTVFSPNITLQDDLSRRDLTINAMARRVVGWNELGHAKLDDEVIDYFGGITDLENRCLRHVSDAFAEDPVRTLRCARFAARYQFNVHPSTIELMKHLGNQGEYSHLTPERVWAETEKAITEPYSTLYADILNDTGYLNDILPGFDINQHIKMRNTTLRTKYGESIPVLCYLYGLSEHVLRMTKAPSHVIKFVKGMIIIRDSLSNISPDNIMFIAETLEMLRNDNMYGYFCECMALITQSTLIQDAIDEARNFHFRHIDESLLVGLEKNEYQSLHRTQRLLIIQQFIATNVT